MSCIFTGFLEELIFCHAKGTSEAQQDPRVDWVNSGFWRWDPYEILHFLEKKWSFLQSLKVTLLK